MAQQSSQEPSNTVAGPFGTRKQAQAQQVSLARQYTRETHGNNPRRRRKAAPRRRNPRAVSVAALEQIPVRDSQMFGPYVVKRSGANLFSVAEWPGPWITSGSASQIIGRINALKARRRKR